MLVYEETIAGTGGPSGFTLKDVRLRSGCFAVQDRGKVTRASGLNIPRGTLIRLSPQLMQRLVDQGAAAAPGFAGSGRTRQSSQATGLARQLVGKQISRDITVNLFGRSVDTEKRTAVLAFSSETEVERWYGIEVLSHDQGHVRLDRLNNGAPLLHGHDRNDQVGVVESAEIQNKVGICNVRLSRSARGEEFLQDLSDNVRRKVSVGYKVNKVEVETVSNDVERVRVVDWEPMEISIVSIPADDTVGVIIS